MAHELGHLGRYAGLRTAGGRRQRAAAAEAARRTTAKRRPPPTAIDPWTVQVLLPSPMVRARTRVGGGLLGSRGRRRGGGGVVNHGAPRSKCRWGPGGCRPGRRRPVLPCRPRRHRWLPDGGHRRRLCPPPWPPSTGGGGADKGAVGRPRHPPGRQPGCGAASQRSGLTVGAKDPGKSRRTCHGRRRWGGPPPHPPLTVATAAGRACGGGRRPGASRGGWGGVGGRGGVGHDHTPPAPIDTCSEAHRGSQLPPHPAYAPLNRGAPHPHASARAPWGSGAAQW